VDTVRVSSKGQIVIPKAVRDAKRIEAGTELAISVIGDEIRLTVAVATPATSVRDVAGILARPAGKRLTHKQEQERIAALIRKSDRATRR